MAEKYVRKDEASHFVRFLLRLTRIRILRMVKCSISPRSLVVDFGCLFGDFTKVLSFMTKTVGLDIDRKVIVRAKRSSRHIDFICADACHLPLRKDSVDIAVFVSVLEYIEDLKTAVEETRNALRKGGFLIAGYPIQTKKLIAILQLFSKESTRIWNPCKVMRREQCRANPHTHKTKFRTIRTILNRNFLLLQKEKIPLVYFHYAPDFISIYECVKMLNIKPT